MMAICLGLFIEILYDFGDIEGELEFWFEGALDRFVFGDVDDLVFVASKLRRSFDQIEADCVDSFFFKDLFCVLQCALFVDFSFEAHRFDALFVDCAEDIDVSF